MDMIDEIAMQEFVAELKGTKFVRRRKDGSALKRYFLSRKTVLNIVGVIKLVLGRKHWRDWDWISARSSVSGSRTSPKHG